MSFWKISFCCYRAAIKKRLKHLVFPFDPTRSHKLMIEAHVSLIRFATFHIHANTNTLAMHDRSVLWLIKAI